MIEFYLMKVLRKLSIEGLRTVILFGSVARESADKASDVDLLFLFSERPTSEQRDRVASFVGELQSKLFKEMKREVHVEAVAEAVEDLSPDFIERVAREGKILFGKPLITSEKAELSPYVLLSYSLRELSKKDKVKTVQVLYGRKAGGGIVSTVGAEKFKNALLVRQEDAKEIEEILKQFKVKYRKVEIWKGED